LPPRGPHKASQFRDRDIIVDLDGRIFVVLGYVQPTGRVLAFLKYIPDITGRWQADGERYRRVFWGGVDSVSKGMGLLPARYTVHDPHFNTDLLQVPNPDIDVHLLPEERLNDILRSGSKDRLESSAVAVAEHIQSILSISTGRLGVAGSILWHGHDPSFSDINMTIYGFEDCWHLFRKFSLLGESQGHFRVRAEDDWRHAAARVKTRIPALSGEDLTRLFSRRKALYYGEQCIGITPVLYPGEEPIQYGHESYTDISSDPVRIEMKIGSCDFGLFHPAVYEGTSEPLAITGGRPLQRILVYDGAFTGLLEPGDMVEVVGTVQKVIPVGSGLSVEPFYQVMVGTKQNAGAEYIRLIQP
jgi:predicted nucleotidyltransferase